MDIQWYTDFFVHGKRFFIRGYDDNGERISQWYSLNPTLYVPCEKQHAKYKTLDGRPLGPVNFDGPKEARQFADQHDQVFGFARFQYEEIDRLFPGKEASYDYSMLRIAGVDIETECENGFPNIDYANEAINVITVGMNGYYMAFHTGAVDTDDDSFHNELEVPADRYYVVQCSDEVDMLRRFVDYWRYLDPDVITGWNISFFDMPYLVNRIIRLTGTELAYKLSPFERLNTQTVTIYQKEMTRIDFCGIATLDYIDLYKKFRMKMQESYKLDHIAHVELGKQKLEYEGPMHTVYKDNFSRWVAYNIQDVYLVQELENQLRYIDLACQIAYMSKTRLEDVFSSVRTWDVMINNYLVNECGIQGPFRKPKAEKNDSYEGAYVKDPLRGKHEWVCSFDLTSLYPCLIMQYNIGPDTILDEDQFVPLSPDDVVNQTAQYEQAKQAADEHHATLTGNGSMYTTQFKGFMATLMERVFQTRKAAKNHMLDVGAEIQQIEQEMDKRGIEHE